MSIEFTKRIRLQEKELFLSRFHTILLKINETVLRAKDQEELFEQVCHIAVEKGGYDIAWIGQLDDTNRKITPIAWHMKNIDLDPSKFTASINEDSPNYEELCSKAISETRVIVTSNLAGENRNSGTIGYEIGSLGYTSAVAMPLYFGSEVWGVLVLHEKKPYTYDLDEIGLLQNLSEYVSLGLGQRKQTNLFNYLTYYDALTGLPNRELLIDRIQHFCQIVDRKESSLALVLIDIERFQILSKILGRQGADDLLKRFASRLKEYVFDRDSIARVYGNTFAWLMVDVNSSAQVARILEGAITSLLEDTGLLDISYLTLFTNSGIAMYPTDANSPDDLMGHAESALKEAKTSPDRCVFYSSGLNEAVLASLDDEHRVRAAVTEEQFELHYQPKIDLQNLKIIGFEALIRWNDPKRGLIMPDFFIPTLEHTSQIIEVGNWAIRQAISDYEKLRARGLNPPTISVNLSQRQLRRPDFVNTIKSILLGHDDHGLGLEITESMLMEDVQGSIDKLVAIRKMGIDLAIDDFGTGYSSLQYLSLLPANYLKIDREFIMNLTNNPNNMTLVSTIINLAHNMGLKVIAEGVETEEQYKMLRLMRCDEAQGYFFSKPKSFEKISNLLSEGGTFEHLLNAK